MQKQIIAKADMRNNCYQLFAELNFNVCGDLNVPKDVQNGLGVCHFCNLDGNGKTKVA